MKKIIYLSFLLVLGLTINAQNIEPVEKMYDYIALKKGIPDNTYFKDINNILGKFVGTWRGTYGNKKYEFKIIRYTSDFLKVKKDRLLVRYIVSDINGNIIENTTLLPDSSPYVMKGNYYVNNGYQLNYIARGGNCSQRGVMTLFVDNTNLGKMDAVLSVEGDLIDGTECPTMINQFFPASPTVFSFTKQ